MEKEEEEEEEEKKGTGNAVYLISGHGCTLEEQITVPERVIWIELALCGDSVYAMERIHLLLQERVKQFFSETPMPVTDSEKDDYNLQLQKLSSMLYKAKFPGESISNGMNSLLGESINISNPTKSYTYKSGIIELYKGDDTLLLKKIETTFPITDSKIFTEIYSNSIFPRSKAEFDALPKSGLSFSTLFTKKELPHFGISAGHIVYINGGCRGYCTESGIFSSGRTSSSGVISKRLERTNTASILENVDKFGRTQLIAFTISKLYPRAIELLNRIHTVEFINQTDIYGKSALDYVLEDTSSSFTRDRLIDILRKSGASETSMEERESLLRKSLEVHKDDVFVCMKILSLMIEITKSNNTLFSDPTLIKTLLYVAEKHRNTYNIFEEVYAIFTNVYKTKDPRLVASGLFETTFKILLSGLLTGDQFLLDFCLTKIFAFIFLNPSEFTETVPEMFRVFSGIIVRSDIQPNTIQLILKIFKYRRPEFVTIFKNNSVFLNQLKEMGVRYPQFNTDIELLTSSIPPTNDSESKGGSRRYRKRKITRTRRRRSRPLTRKHRV